MERYTELLNDRILEFNELLKVDLKLNDMNIKEQSLKTPAIKAKWLQYSFEESAYLRKLEKTKGLLFDQYYNKHGKPGVPKYVTEKEIESTNEIMAMDEAIKEQKNTIRYLDGVLTIMKTVGFDIKNSIDIIKLENA
jgi:hypothetical protein